jgi:hypothetical protein
MSATELVDPRAWPAADGGDAFATQLYDVAQAALVASTGREADALDATARDLLASALAGRRDRALAHALRDAPSLGVARHLRRLLADIERAGPPEDETLATTLFAIPVVIVAALDAGGEPTTLRAVLSDAPALAAILREGRAFGGSETFGLATALTGADAIDVPALPALLARMRAGGRGSLDLAPAPIAIREASERVHLRFIAGAVLAPRRVDPLAEPNVGAWGIALARAIADALHARGATLLALPRPPQRLVPAMQSGRAAQREVSAQLFAANAIRKFRASRGEPTAIISAHRAAGAPGGGELRLSLSSPFAPEEAEGFRCPVYPYETVQDVGAMLQALMRDCRVADLRFMPGIYADIDPLTGGPLFFKHTATARCGATH